MSFWDYLTLPFDRRPVFLYRIERAGSVVYLTTKKGGYATAIGVPDASFVAATDWAESSVKCSDISQSSKRERSDVTLTFRASYAFARAFTGVSAPVVSSLTIWEVDENDPDQECAFRFRGRITDAKATREETQLICAPGRRAKGMVPVLQRMCRHTVYFGGCGLDREDWFTDATATNVDGRIITVTEAAAYADGVLAFGLLEYGSGLFTIAANAGTQVRLLMEAPDLAAAVALDGTAPVRLARGCNRLMPVCDGVFDNSDNMGGVPTMDDSPFDGRSLL